MRIISTNVKKHDMRCVMLLLFLGVFLRKLLEGQDLIAIVFVLLLASGYFCWQVFGNIIRILK